MPTGRIFNIQRYSLHDGPGIRTTVFLKGCPLRCWWCHNPESQDPRAEIVYVAGRCAHCDACRAVCPSHEPVFDRATDPDADRCSRCGQCVDACPTDARQYVGRETTVEHLMAEVIRDEVFWDESGGGVTISGGEPLVQSEFVVAMLTALRRRGIHTALDTSGFAPREALLATAPVTDLYLYDIKLLDARLHELYTGVPNRLILDNLAALAQIHHNLWIRVPIIPGINDSPDELAAIARLARSLPAVKQVNLLPYHNTACHKFGRLGRTCRLPDVKTPGESDMQAAARPFVDLGLPTFSGG
ncbi:MAG: glycyl-radical enzyme activating protein [Tepidisphaerales bacterium]